MITNPLKVGITFLVLIACLFVDNSTIRCVAGVLLVGIVGAVFLSAVTPTDRSSSNVQLDDETKSNMGQGNGGG